jgi:hypothetical protein
VTKWKARFVIFGGGVMWTKEKYIGLFGRKLVRINCKVAWVLGT